MITKRGDVVKRFLIFIFTFLFLFGVSGCADVNKLNDNTGGNSNGNLVNGGLIAYHDDYLYFSSGKSLYKSKPDGSEAAKIYELEEDGIIANINASYDAVYFSGGNSEGGGLYKINSDGSGVKRIISDTEGGIRKNVYLTDEWIYYDKNYRLKRSGDGSDKEQIADISERSDTFNISDGYIYYCGRDLNDEYQKNKK